MSTGHILLLGAIAGLTIFIGLPVSRMQNLSANARSGLSALATGILVFLLWDVLSNAGWRAASSTRRSRRGTSAPR